MGPSERRASGHLAQTRSKTQREDSRLQAHKRGLAQSCRPWGAGLPDPGTMGKYVSFAEATPPVAPGYMAGRADSLGVHPALPPRPEQQQQLLLPWAQIPGQDRGPQSPRPHPHLRALSSYVWGGALPGEVPGGGSDDRSASLEMLPPRSGPLRPASLRVGAEGTQAGVGAQSLRRLEASPRLHLPNLPAAGGLAAIGPVRGDGLPPRPRQVGSFTGWLLGWARGRPEPRVSHACQLPA